MTTTVECEVEATVYEHSALDAEIVDAIDADRWYRTKNVARLLGVTFNDINSARHDGRFAHTGELRPDHIRGCALLAWIAHSGLVVAIDRDLLAADQAEQRAPAEAAERSRLAALHDPFNAAFAESRDDEGSTEDEIRRARRQYVALLVTEAAGELVDEAVCVELVAVLGLDRRRIKFDRRIVKNALAAEKVSASLDAAAVALDDVRERHNAVLSEHEKRIRPLDEGLAVATKRYGAATEAAAALVACRKDRPELFAEGDPPRLLAAERTTKPKAGKKS